MKVKLLPEYTEPQKNPLLLSADPYLKKKEDELVVYALCTFKGEAYYCIKDEDSLFPMWHSHSIFNVIDNRLSRYWVFGLDEDNNKKVPILSFPEWVADEYFYGEMLEDNDPNLTIFNKYKELMDFEFPDSSISATAEIGDKEWLICYTCMDAWQSKNDKDALIRHSKCYQIFNNPRYKNEWPHF